MRSRGRGGPAGGWAWEAAPAREQQVQGLSVCSLLVLEAPQFPPPLPRKDRPRWLSGVLYAFGGGTTNLSWL